ncbi:MAG: glycosyltransferase family A protein [Nitrososphaerota archaeon]
MSRISIIVFILAFKEKPWAPLVALSKQTLKPEKIVIVAGYPSACVEKFPNIKSIECMVIPPNLKLSVGERVGIALTIAFKKYQIHSYDYIVRLDEDFYFDERFLEDNIRAGYDLVGCHGAMIMKSDKLIKVLKGKWAISPMDDALVIDMFRASNCLVLPWSWIRPPWYLRYPRDTFSRGVMFGVELYRNGYPLINLLLDIISKTIFSRIIRRLSYRKMKTAAVIGMLVGYVTAFLRKEKKSNLAMMLTKFYKTSSLIESYKTIMKELRTILNTNLIFKKGSLR